MNDRIRHYWEIVRTSLWLVPVLMGCAGFGLAVLLLSWGRGIISNAGEYWLIYAGDIDSARQLLSALLSGMITMTSLVVSITMVVLTLAAGQIGPRLIRTFIQDRTTQGVLGLFLADIVYLLVVFRTMDGERIDSVPHLAVSVGTGLTTLCLFVLLYYVHRLARSIIYDNVVQNVASELCRMVDALLPEKPEPPIPAESPGTDFTWLALHQDGYIQTLDAEALVAAARRADAVVRIEVRPGHFMIGGGEHIAVYPPEACTDDFCRAVRSAFIVGPERTPTQDVEFGIRQLVEIATRALSPGINDVFTALAVIDNLSAALAHIFGRGLEPSVLRDGDGVVRVIRNIPDYDSFVGAAFDQIRQGGSGSPAILIRLAEALGELAARVHAEEMRGPLLEQLDSVLATGEQTISIDRDLRILKERCRQARDRLSC
ncbi:DUF2254 domain-containing protein [Azospirillum sp. TSH64]|uniref:DUF2254 domain-containing protein n=1 Tax=Azospirillum sp. TSH64 TaxID=652740 RepID=UPI000D616F73|nr:DUF2254 domain-containing protein [Azospirillum sp. TSH64]PWC80123.1 hypothetical protein TSH64_33265 [Azospirillum sp. TSH64]